MSDTDRQELARAAGLGDLVAARRLVQRLEREADTEWWTFPHVFSKGIQHRPRQEVMVAIDDRKLDRKTLAGWRWASPEDLAKALRVDLARVPGLPLDVEVLAIWSEPNRRRTCLIVGHPSFSVVPDGEECPEFNEFIAQLAREREAAERIAADVERTTGIRVPLFPMPPPDEGRRT